MFHEGCYTLTGFYTDFSVKNNAMRQILLMFLLMGMLLSSATAANRKPAPEALVVIAYISTLRCEAQHPALRKRLRAALSSWQTRNKKYVISAKKMINFKAIASRYKELKRHDKHFSYQTCTHFIYQLRNPANDVIRQYK